MGLGANGRHKDTQSLGWWEGSPLSNSSVGWKPDPSKTISLACAKLSEVIQIRGSPGCCGLAPRQCLEDTDSPFPHGEISFLPSTSRVELTSDSAPEKCNTGASARMGRSRVSPSIPATRCTSGRGAERKSKPSYK